MWTLIVHLSKHGCPWYSPPLFAKGFVYVQPGPFAIPIWGYNCSNYSKIGATQLEKQPHEKIYHQQPLTIIASFSGSIFSLCASSLNKDLQICTFFLCWQVKTVKSWKLLLICMFYCICWFEICGEDEGVWEKLSVIQTIWCQAAGLYSPRLNYCPFQTGTALAGLNSANGNCVSKQVTGPSRKTRPRVCSHVKMVYFMGCFKFHGNLFKSCWDISVWTSEHNVMGFNLVTQIIFNKRNYWR